MPKQPPRFFLLLLAAFLGGVVGAVTYAVLGGNEDQRRGTIVRIGSNLHQIDVQPFCVQSQHFCVVKLDSGDLIALYTYDTHSLMRPRGCDVAWDPDFNFGDPATGENALGWFRGRCSGSIYRMNGELVFGPGPRDLDRFPLTLVQDKQDNAFIEVDTRELICGDYRDRVSSGCVRAPLQQ